MKAKNLLAVVLFFLGVTAIFFYPVFQGKIPFPGDLVVGHYEPWRSSSYLGYAPGGVPHKAQGIDVARQFFPWKYFSIQMIKQGELPLWNPYNFSGNPHLANFQTGVFYPLNILFLLLPFNLAWTIFIISQPLLASLFTYLFAREIKISRFGSFLAGLAFAFCLYFTVWLEYGNIGQAILWLPLSLFLIKRIVKETKLKWFALLIFSLTLSILAGFIQVTIYLFGVVYAFFFFQIFLFGKKKTRLLKTILVFVAGLVALVIASVQLLPTWEIFQQSAREAYPPEKIPEVLLPWFYPLTSFVSDFFGNPASRNYWLPGTYIERVSYLGVLPLLFAFFALVKRKREKAVLFFALVAALALFFSLNLWPVRLLYSLEIPIISTTVYTRLLSVFSFSAAILAGFGFDFWQKMLKTEKWKKIMPLFTFFAGAYFFLWLGTFLVPAIFPSSWWLSHLKISRRNLILPTGIAFAFVGLNIGLRRLRGISKMRKLVIRYQLPLTAAAVFLLIIFDLFFYFHKITPFSPPEFVYPSTNVFNFLQKKAGINRFWGYGTAYIDSNFSTFNRTFSTDGWDALYIRRYGELLAAARNQGVIPQEIPRSDAYIEKGFGPEELKKNPYRQRLMNLLGVKYVLHKNEWVGETWQPDTTTFSEQAYRLIWQENQWQIYENKQALPRIFLTGYSRQEEDPQKIMNLIFDPQFSLDVNVILEESLPPDFLLDQKVKGEITDLDYQPSRVTMEVRTTGNSLLFLSDNYYSGWRALIDGQETKIYRADYTFRAIAVPEGEHKIVFSYEPQVFQLGTTISGGAFLVVLTTFFFLRRFW